VKGRGNYWGKVRMDHGGQISVSSGGRAFRVHRSGVLHDAFFLFFFFSLGQSV
jgi:hypothetical protein